MKKLFVLVVGIVMLGGCATTTATKGDFLGEHYNKMVSGPKGGAKLRWIKPETDFTKYKKFMVDYVVFAFAEDSQSKKINGDEMKKLGDSCTLAVVNAIKDKYPIVSEPGPDVLRFRFAIVDMKQSNPVLSTISTVVPVGMGISILKKGATDSWSGSGSTTSQWMFVDSMSNEVLAVVEDHYAAGFTERFSKWGSSEDAFKYWGARIRKVIDNGMIPDK